MNHLCGAVFIFACLAVACVAPTAQLQQGAGGMTSVPDLRTPTSPIASPIPTDARQKRCVGPTVSLTPHLASGVVVKKQRPTDVLDIAITTCADPLLFQGLVLGGQARIGSCAFGTACARKGFARRVTSLSIYRSGAQLGYAKAPDTVTGTSAIPVNIALAAFATTTFTVKASFASVVSPTGDLDAIAVGLMAPPALQRLDESERTTVQCTHANLTRELQEQLGAHPPLVHLIRPSGTIAIEKIDNPLLFGIKQIDNEMWSALAEYEVTSRYETASIDMLSVAVMTTYPPNPNDVVDVVIGLMTEGKILGSMTIPHTRGRADLELFRSPLVVPKDQSVRFQLWAKLQQFKDLPHVAGWSVLPSGRAPVVALANGIISGEWDASYQGMLNARTTGQVSGERMYAPQQERVHGMSL